MGITITVTVLILNYYILVLDIILVLHFNNRSKLQMISCPHNRRKFKLVANEYLY